MTDGTVDALRSPAVAASLMVSHSQARCELLDISRRVRPCVVLSVWNAL